MRATTDARDVPWRDLLMLLALSLPIGWTHWWYSKNLNTRLAAQALLIPMADKIPGMSPLVEYWDEWQEYLISHQVGKRHQGHKTFHLQQIAEWPSRAQGQQIKWSERNLVTIGTVGVPAWVLPEVAVIDLLGLNDYRVAHAPLDVSNEKRSMAHDRVASLAYSKCFEPTVFRIPVPGEKRIQLPAPPADIETLRIDRREASISEYDATIKRCETQSYDRVAWPISRIRGSFEAKDPADSSTR